MILDGPPIYVHATHGVSIRMQSYIWAGIAVIGDRQCSTGALYSWILDVAENWKHRCPILDPVCCTLDFVEWVSPGQRFFIYVSRSSWVDYTDIGLRYESSTFPECWTTNSLPTPPRFLVGTERMCDFLSYTCSIRYRGHAIDYGRRKMYQRTLPRALCGSFDFNLCESVPLWMMDDLGCDVEHEWQRGHGRAVFPIVVGYGQEDVTMLVCGSGTIPSCDAFHWSSTPWMIQNPFFAEHSVHGHR